ncbi:MAG TPA: exodeoxyribonuclease VII large subunit [Blastocatellia bacterium]|jgi:exodeoxyribonuclease VII large subunit|nr:exodeoxyribonuclease VII large subunit [Blastocatellia bacterium]
MPQLSFLEQLMQERRALSVSELTAQVKILIERQFLEVWVEGEVSNFRRHSSGHWYFTLKDEGAMLRCASFRMQNRLIRFTPEDGLTVRAHGRISLYETRGEYQLLVEFLEPVGVGALQLAFEQMKSRLASEGLFDIERKRALPLLPRCVGVVTSPTGAALRDILRVIKRRNESVSVLIAPARVQGEGAGLEIAEAIELLNRREEVDVIIVGRGGGSAEDLWAFNEEAVARAIFNSRAPVISAVGHETDFTIADFVADMRASTPSAAAEIVSLARDEIHAQIRGLNDAMAGAVRYRLLQLQNDLSEVESSRAFNEVSALIQSCSQRLDSASYSLENAFRAAIKRGRASHEATALRLRDSDVRRDMIERRGEVAVLSERLKAAGRARVEGESEKLAVQAVRLNALSPLAVLGRGYAIAFDSDGRIIKRSADTSSGSRLRIRLGEGEVECTVD